MPQDNLVVNTSHKREKSLFSSEAQPETHFHSILFDLFNDVWEDLVSKPITATNLKESPIATLSFLFRMDPTIGVRQKTLEVQADFETFEKRMNYQFFWHLLEAIIRFTSLERIETHQIFL